MIQTQIISIDGGGALATGSARFLAHLERDNGDLHESALAGTSAGGILVLLRAAGYTWRDVQAIFDEEVSSIFSDQQLYLIGPKWDVDPLNSLAKKYLDVPARRAALPFFVVASNSTRGCPKIFDHTDDVSMADIALATSAAPTYFAPHQIGTEVFVDGGLIANNPSLVGLTGARKAGIVQTASAHVLSLATGGKCWIDPKVHEQMLITSWIAPALKLAIYGRQQMDAHLCTQEIGDRHLRIEPAEQDYSMDDISILDQHRTTWDQAYVEFASSLH